MIEKHSLFGLFFLLFFLPTIISIVSANQSTERTSTVSKGATNMICVAVVNISCTYGTCQGGTCGVCANNPLQRC